MEIKEIKEFNVVDSIEKSGTTPKILLENTRTKKQVEVFGKVLEAQYRIGDDFLLLITEGNSFEEALYVYYFNGNLQLIDSLELSAMYTEGMLRNLSVINPDTIHFSFFENDDRWSLKILPNPKYIIFGRKYPVKRKSPLLRKCKLILEKS